MIERPSLAPSYATPRTYATPRSWTVVALALFVGSIAAMVGSGVLAPAGYHALGGAMLWLGTGAMVGGALVVISVFLRLIKPPGIRDSEW